MTYKVQVDDFVRPATADEATQLDQIKIQVEEMEQHEAAQETAKQSARTKLAALGLTEEEITALIG